MWVALVGSHVLAFSTVMLLRPDAAGSPGSWPTFPSLPPLPGSPAPAPEHPPGPPSFGAHDAAMRPPPPMDEGHAGHPAGPRWGAGMGMRPQLPAWLLALDYGIRLLVIGLAAWWGARWLSRPMRTLATASRSLTSALGQSTGLPKLDDTEGTVEVQDAARVFNEMAGELHQQFRTRGLMMAAISHDLRTPLTRIRMRMESLQGDPLAERCVADIREMNELIDSSLEVFRGMDSAEAPQVTDVFSLIQSITDDLVEQGQPVAFEGQPAIVQVRPMSLRRVVSSLIHNAVRYGARAEVSVALQAHHVLIAVTDQGPGIPPAHLEAVFQPFYRVDSSRNRHTGGIGLGLYIARDLITRQGGTLTLLNRPEGGLRAEVRLPRT